MKKIVTGMLLSVFLLSLLSACFMSNPKTSTGEYRHTNIRIFQDTPAWELAQAVYSQNTRRIDAIAQKSPEMLDYIDPMYGLTLLIWSVGMERYNSAQALLRNGANPDIIGTHTGGTALFLASEFSWIDTRANKDPRFVELLLHYGADPNINFVGDGRSNVLEIGTSPLMASIGTGIEKTRALVAGGADINHKTETGWNAVFAALSWGEEECSSLRGNMLIS